MSRRASNFQKVVMSWTYRGKEIFKPLNTGRIDELCNPFRKQKHDPSAPYDGYDESDDTEEGARNVSLAPVIINKI